MKNLRIGMIAWVLGGMTVAQFASAQKAPPSQQPSMPQKAPTTQPMSSPANLQPVFKDIERTLGFVPQFFRQLPDALLPAWWDSMKTFQMNPNTALDPKTKELIGLAVSAQVPCTYCAYFHTAAARSHGATEQEIREAVGMASLTRMGSTLLNGMQVDNVQFRKDVDRVFKKRNGSPTPHAQATPAPTQTP